MSIFFNASFFSLCFTLQMLAYGIIGPLSKGLHFRGTFPPQGGWKTKLITEICGASASGEPFGLNNVTAKRLQYYMCFIDPKKNIYCICGVLHFQSKNLYDYSLTFKQLETPNEIFINLYISRSQEMVEAQRFGLNNTDQHFLPPQGRHSCASSPACRRRCHSTANSNPTRLLFVHQTPCGVRW